jgi:hypothetical protein
MIYTTIIMLSCILAAVLAVLRARVNDVVFGPSVWLGANCKLSSLLRPDPYCILHSLTVYYHRG